MLQIIHIFLKGRVYGIKRHVTKDKRIVKMHVLPCVCWCFDVTTEAVTLFWEILSFYHISFHQDQDHSLRSENHYNVYQFKTEYKNLLNSEALFRIFQVNKPTSKFHLSIVKLPELLLQFRKNTQSYIPCLVSNSVPCNIMSDNVSHRINVRSMIH